MDEDKLAPTASIETVMIVRPLKVLAVTFGFLTLVLTILFVGATTWVSVDDVRFGLWEECTTVAPKRVSCQIIDERYPQEPLTSTAEPCFAPQAVTCDPAAGKTWLYACRGLCLLAAIMTIAANFVVIRGLRGEKFRTRYRCYYIGMLLYFLAVLFNVTALIIYPIKYSEEVGRRSGNTWSFGWAYGVGWGATVLLITSALLLCLDKDADEIVFRERTSSENGIEEELLTESETDKTETESDAAYADGTFK